MEEKPISTKKALFVLGSLFILIALSLVVPARYVGLEGKQQPELILDTEANFVQLQKDENNNGNPDWQDMLQEETSTTTKELAKTMVVDDATKKRLADPDNITSSFTKNTYTASMYAKQQNLTEAQQEEMAINILAEEQAKLTPKTYEVTDLRLTKEETDISRKTYINSLGTIYKKNRVSTLSVDDIPTMEAYTTSKDTSLLTSFVVKKNIIDTIITQLLAMTVPYSAASYHLLLINSLSGYSSMLSNLSKAGDDPMRATLAFNNYAPTVKSVYSSLTSLASYITVENITFTPNDPGYILVSGGQ